MNERRAIWAGVGMLAALGLALRTWHIAAVPLWLDEAYSAYAAAKGFAFLWHIVPRYETHPPVYYSLVRLWTLAFGDGLIALRALGLIAGSAALAVTAAAAGEAGRTIGRDAAARRRLAFAAFALGCVATAMVEMAREVRPYPVMMLAYAAATFALLRIARRARGGRPLAGLAYAGYLLTAEAMLWLHNLGPLFAAALGLALIAAIVGRASRRDWAWLAGGHLLIGLAWLPGLAILIDQAPTWVSSTWLRFDVARLPDRLAPIYAAYGVLPTIAALTLLALALAALRQAGEGLRLAMILLTLAAVPTLLSIALSLTVTPVFISRTLTPVAAPTLILFAIGAAAFGDRRRWIGAGAALILGGHMLAVEIQARRADPPQDWYGTVAWLRERVRPGDQIFAYPNEGALPLAFALRDKGLAYPIRAIPTPVPTLNDPDGWYPTGSRGVVSLPRSRLRAIAEEAATRAVPTIWLLRLGPWAYDKGDIFLRELARGRHGVRRWRAGPIDIVGLARGPRPAAPIEADSRRAR